MATSKQKLPGHIQNPGKVVKKVLHITCYFGPKGELRSKKKWEDVDGKTER